MRLFRPFSSSDPPRSGLPILGRAPEPLPAAPGRPVALYPVALLCLAPGGGELLWRGMSRDS